MINLRNSWLALAFLVGFVPQVHAAIAVVQHHESYLGGTTTTTYTLGSLSAAPTPGNSIIVQFAANGGGPLLTVTDSYGNTFTKVVAESDSSNVFSHVDTEIWWLPALPAGGSGTYSIICGPTTPSVGGAPNGSIIEVSGIALLDQSGVAQDVAHANTSLTATASGANTAAAEIVFAHMWTGAAGSAINQPPNTGYTGTLNQYGQLSGGYKIVSSIETSQGTWTWTGATYGAATIATFKASTGAVLAGAATDAVTAAGALTTQFKPYTPILLDDPAHINGSDQIYMGTGPNTGTGDTAFVVFPKLKQWAIDANSNFAKLFPIRSVQTPVTGFTIAAVANVTQLVLNPAGTLATGTVTFPQAPGDNQPFMLMTSQTITALTANTADGSTINGAPTTLSANTSVKFRFVTSLNTWFRE